MRLVARTLGQYIFTVGYSLVMLLTLVFVVPFVLAREFWQLKTKKKSSHNLAILFVVLGTFTVTLSGCQSVAINVTNQADQVLNDALDISRVTEFAATAPEVPYQASDQDFSQPVEDLELTLTEPQLAMVVGAAQATDVEPALVAYVIEQELRGLDPNELERDVLAGLAGQDPSIGIGQVRISTAEEIEQNDSWQLFPTFEEDQESRDDRVRRLSNDAWSALYAAAYLELLESRYPADQALDSATRYTGRTPSTGELDRELYDGLERAL
jgi:hypothetical protein